MQVHHISETDQCRVQIKLLKFMQVYIFIPVKYQTTCVNFGSLSCIVFFFFANYMHANFKPPMIKRAGTIFHTTPVLFNDLPEQKMAFWTDIGNTSKPPFFQKKKKRKTFFIIFNWYQLFFFEKKGQRCGTEYKKKIRTTIIWIIENNEQKLVREFSLGSKGQVSPQGSLAKGSLHSLISQSRWAHVYFGFSCGKPNQLCPMYNCRFITKYKRNTTVFYDFFGFIFGRQPMLFEAPQLTFIWKRCTQKGTHISPTCPTNIDGFLHLLPASSCLSIVQSQSLQSCLNVGHQMIFQAKFGIVWPVLGHKALLNQSSCIFLPLCQKLTGLILLNLWAAGLDRPFLKSHRTGSGCLHTSRSRCGLEIK
ncbi:hypothetical protein VP01_191g6 [Puccinia sorghi]|uniref:Uncharacterized protein n=1 Tax=Puccinia sorghi TaxID=27349 RepID=A0A0L6VD57_9BASI|nr:hypothetical protein VP01_191g6 [Puccinia sorghi]